jgi:predicted MPP superfamily phosphohydrolase
MFIIIFSLIYGGAHLYIWARLLHPLEITGVSLRILQGLFILLFLSFPLIHIAFRQQNGFLISAANLVSSIWMGMVVYFVLVTLCSDLLRLIIFRTVFDGSAVSAVITTVVVAITVYGLIAARSIGITRLQVRMPNLPSQLEGLRIVHVSDVHMGRIVRGPRLERIVTMVNDLQPDLIVITGDLVDAEALHMEDMVHPLRRLKSKYGIFAVPGNHEYFAGIERSQAFIEQAGVTMLRNRWVTIADGLQLVGRDDPTGARVTGEKIPSLEEIMRGTDRSKPTILLYHTPVTTFEELQARGIQLQLSGHTHKGQLWPFNYIVKLIYKMPYGRFASGDTTVYVSRGTGTWGPPMRVAARPEITLITLSAKR